MSQYKEVKWDGVICLSRYVCQFVRVFDITDTETVNPCYSTGIQLLQ